MQNFLLEKKAAMLIESDRRDCRNPAEFYDAMFGKDALRNAAKIEIPGYRKLKSSTPPWRRRISPPAKRRSPSSNAS